MKPFFYVIWQKPTKPAEDDGAVGQILSHGVLLARDENHARMLASCKIPSNITESQLSRVEVAVRPF